LSCSNRCVVLVWLYIRFLGELCCCIRVALHSQVVQNQSVYLTKTSISLANLRVVYFNSNQYRRVVQVDSQK
jgi:hypothetical protein